MTKRTYYLGVLVLAAAVAILATTAGARPLLADTGNNAGISRGELGRLDLFLDSHPDIAKALVANPGLATNQNFVSDHPAWKAFLQDHSEIREGLQANPTGFMNDEEKLKAVQNGGSGQREPMGPQQKEFAAFLNQHPAIAKQLAANPSLIEQKSYVEDHPELEAFLKDKPALRDRLLDNPNSFMSGVKTVEAVETNAGTPKPATTQPAPTSSAGAGSASNGANPTMPPTKAPPKASSDNLSRSQIVALDQFLDAHPGLARQLEANPTLINDNASFMKDNPDLAAFLQDHPDLAEDWRAAPALTMTDVRRLNQIETARAIGNERSVDARSAAESFDNFLDSHPVIAADINHHSSLATEVSFIDAHPELKAYLQQNPGVAAELRNNPQSFMSLVSALNKQQPPPRGKKEDLKPTLALSHK